MAIILNIETATKNCSVSLAKNGQVLAIKELNNGNYSHAELLHQFIKDVFTEQKMNQSDVDAIAVSKGPGSYTGLRIGVSAAKGLCFALDIPLISIDTLEALSYSIKIDKGFIVPMIDARRMEVYTSVFDKNHKTLEKTSAKIIDESSFLNYLEKDTICFLGDGALKCKETITHSNAFFIADKFPSSKEMASLSFLKFQQKQFEDVAYFEPFYLKNFIVIPEKKKKRLF